MLSYPQIFAMFAFFLALALLVWLANKFAGEIEWAKLMVTKLWVIILFAFAAIANFADGESALALKLIVGGAVFQFGWWVLNLMKPGDD